MPLTTKLQAVNFMLAAVGDSPVNQLGTGTIINALLAENKLDAVTKEVNAEGWQYNYESGVTLIPDVSGAINLDDTILRAYLDRSARTAAYQSLSCADIAQRGTQLYDRANHTYVFTKNIIVEVVYDLPWDSLPEAARNFIKIRSARQFQVETLGSTTLTQVEVGDEQKARMDLDEHEGLTGGYNVFDNYDTFQIIDRPVRNIPGSL